MPIKVVVHVQESYVSYLFVHECCRIGRDLRRDKGSYSNDVLQREQEKEAHKVVKILTVVVIVFAILMLPNHIVFIWIDFGSGSKCSWN